jgi:repressor LexA
MNELAANIKNYRLFRNLSQRKLAEKLDKSINTVANWERGLSSPDVNTLVAICQALEVTPNELLGYDINKEYEAYLVDVMHARELFTAINEKHQLLEEERKEILKKYGNML